MNLTPAAANLLVEAADRSDRSRRAVAASDMRMALRGDDKQFADALRRLKR